MKLYFILLATFLLILVSTDSFSAQQESVGDAAVAESEATQVTPETWRSFETLFEVINEAKKELGALRTKLSDAMDDTEREQIRNEIILLQSNIDSLQLAWEMWATGGVDLELFTPKKEEKFDWRQEIQSVFEPIVVELQRLTERPRKIDRLHTEQTYYQQRLAAAAAALKNIDDYKRKAPSTNLQGAFSDLESNWRKRYDEINSRLTLINLQLEELLSTSRLADETASEALKELLSGRFVNLLLAILAASITYGVLHMVNRLYVRLITLSGRRRPFLARVAHLSFMLIAVMLALIAGMAVLYMRGDRILLGLMLIALIGAALTLQRTLPGFIKEARVLLNIGPVREGQRVVYNGLPWKVQSLNMYSTVVNPALCGGKLRLPLSVLTGLVSRTYDETEPWFPTRENDYVLLNDQTYGRVVLQTPEMVQLRVLESDRTYPVDAFLSSNPQNLSQHGFSIIVRFGVDYQHQGKVTGEIKQKFEDYLAANLKESKVGGYLKELLVEFDEAAASSLNFFIFASFAGEAAESYYRISRIMQGLAVDACNANGWVIPFNQMTVHLAQEGQPPSSSSSKK